ncbi:MAG: DNA alkylation repair protein [Alphaproteobacteria bacterium]
MKKFKKITEITKERLELLSMGQVETETLIETCAVDFNKLCKHITSVSLGNLPKGVIQRMQNTALIIIKHNLSFSDFIEHPSDIVRGWGVYMIALDKKLTLEEKMEHVRIPANDPHFAVREWAWLAMRPYCTSRLSFIINSLKQFIKSNENHKRFASEITRPRSVWGQHIEELKRRPEIAFKILSILCDDPSIYVKKSISNWLCDAYYSKPQWVLSVLETLDSTSENALWTLNRVKKRIQNKALK